MKHAGKQDKSGEGSTGIRTLIVSIVVWTGVSVAAFRWFLGINLVLSVGALVCIFAGKLRQHLPQGFSSRKPLLGTLVVAVIGFGAAMSARGNAAAEEQEAASNKRIAVAESDRKIRSAVKRLNELSKKLDTEPVAVYLALVSILPKDPISTAHPDYAALKKAVGELKENVSKPYAAHLAKQAASSLQKNELGSAQTNIKEALRIDSTIPGGKELSDRIFRSLAKNAAEESAVYLRKASAETMEKSRKWIRTKEFMGASGLLSLRLKSLREHAELHGEHVSLATLEKRLSKLLTSIAPKVEKQQAHEAHKQIERTELLEYCGKPPKRAALGSIREIALFVMQSAHDPASIEVSNCSTYVLDENNCWTTSCNVRGKNPLGAKVLSRKKFSLERDKNDSTRYIVRQLK